MIGIVIVAHSQKLAEGVKELAEQMSQGRVPIVAAGGLDDTTIGTNMERILSAINAVYQPDGVLVLMDLGSAVMSAEMAIETLSPEQQAKVLLSPAPLVEGAIAAAVEAAIGNSLAEVNAAACAVVNMPKVAGVAALSPEQEISSVPTAEAPSSNEITLTLINKSGLHARPAALFVQTAGSFQSTITVRNLSRNTTPVSAKSMFGVLGLGAQQNHRIAIAAEGPDAAEVLAVLRQLAGDGFGEMEQTPVAPAKEFAGPPLQETRVIPRSFVESAPHLVARGRMRKFQGVAASAGIAIGPAYLYRPLTLNAPQRKVEDPEAEWVRFTAAVEKAKAQIKATRDKAVTQVGRAAAEIFTAHLLFLEDPGLLDQMRVQITKEGLNAEAALAKAVAGYADVLRNMDDDLFRQRAADVEDVGQRVLRILRGISDRSLAELPEPAVLVARDLAPSDTFRLEKERVLGFCTAAGGVTSHTAILASSLGLPSVVGLGEKALDIPDGTPLIIDGEAGVVVVNPDEEILAAYRVRRESLVARQVAARQAGQGPALTRDGHRVEVAANVADVASTHAALEYGAEGIGLLRTEFLYLDRPTMPSEEEQVAAYQAIAEVMDQRPVIIRTLDIGGDKPAPYFAIGQELNPFLGWRAIRLCLGQPDMFKIQLRAILRSGYKRNVKIMFPMIATLQELLQAKALLREARDELAAEGLPHAEDPEVGIMVEVPAAAIAADVLAQEADFFSIGTNDLIQYTLACDRTNERVAFLYQPLHPAVLRLIRGVIDAAHVAGRWVGMCGEMAGQEEAVPILLGLGLDEFSMTSSAIPTVKRIIRSLSLTEAREIADRALRLSTTEEIQVYVKEVLQRLAGEEEKNEEGFGTTG
ncbi:phosphotransferase system, enzyme I, PtsI [Candidatus Hakubella thermalkaliphila]|uniref:Phosphocarrier protein HPr n=1 Tax=Candidatus Hakubella thermalkaliphila TaxID=2754717 RepID=A0A6V8NZ91_9ACTN|nr:phosphotransferase system, enzyme I, PtsI [Candidatus Hakubella thermalkaliphila]